MQVNDRALDDLVVRNVEINGIVGAQPRGTPVDFPDLGETVAYLEPVADFVGTIDLERHAGDDAAKEILPGKSENNCGDARAGQHTPQFALSVIARAQNEEQCDKKDDERHDFAQEMRNRRLLALLEIPIPDITINQS